MADEPVANGALVVRGAGVLAAAALLPTGMEVVRDIASIAYHGGYTTGALRTVSDAISAARDVASNGPAIREGIVDALRFARRGMQGLSSFSTTPGQITSPAAGRAQMEDRPGMNGVNNDSSYSRTAYGARGCSLSTWMGCSATKGKFVHQVHPQYSINAETDRISKGIMVGCKYSDMWTYTTGTNSLLTYTQRDRPFFPAVGPLEQQRASRVCRLRSMIVRLTLRNHTSLGSPAGIGCVRCVVYQDMHTKGQSYSTQENPFTLLALGAVGNYGVIGHYDPETVPERFRVYADHTYVLKGSTATSGAVRTSSGMHHDEFTIQFPPTAVVTYKPSAPTSSYADIDSGDIFVHWFTLQDALVNYTTRITFDDAADVT